jgi:hypothetical protein
MTTYDLITIDVNILGGTPVFKGTRVPLRTLFRLIDEGMTIWPFEVTVVSIPSPFQFVREYHALHGIQVNHRKVYAVEDASRNGML